MTVERFDKLGGLMTLVNTGRQVVVTVSEGAPARNVQPLPVAAHVLDADDLAGLAHWLLRQALTLGDLRAEVVTACGALALLGDREEAQAGG